MLIFNLIAVYGLICDFKVSFGVSWILSFFHVLLVASYDVMKSFCLENIFAIPAFKTIFDSTRSIKG